MTDADCTKAITAQVNSAQADQQALEILGAGSKSFYANRVTAAPLDITAHRGIVNYEPTELVLTARAGTPLSEIAGVLAEQGQMLAFEPPSFCADATLGGAIASGLSGPARPYWGSVRDMVLGIQLLNGKGELMRFGGQVMKNVAGYDVARLNVGALGTLGVIMEVSVKVLPAPAQHASLVFEAPMIDCHTRSEQWLRAGRPLSAMLHDGERLYVRLSGTESAVADARTQLGGEPLDDKHADTFWASVHNQTHAFFATEDPIWRLSLPPGINPNEFDGEKLSEWSGQQLWLRGVQDAAALRAKAAQLGGNATAFRNKPDGISAFQPLDAVKQQLHQRIKKSFDPHAIFNPGRLYPDLEEA